MTDNATWVDWQTWGPIYNVRAPWGGFLSCSYTDGIDTRWGDGTTGLICKGPAFTAIDCSGVGGTAANANSAAISGLLSSHYYVYVSRGTIAAKIRISDMTVMAQHPATLSERCTYLFAVTEASGTIVMVECMAATAYRVRTPVAPASTDTVATNSASQIIRVGGVAPDRVAGFTGQSALGNILSSTTTMTAPNWKGVGTYRAPITPTGFALVGDLWGWGTDRGLLMNNARLGRFDMTAVRLDLDADNCRAMFKTPWSSIGTLVPLRRMIRSQDGPYDRRVGPESWVENDTPVQGKMMGADADADWGIATIYNPLTTNTYVVAFRPSQPGDWHGNPLSWYVLRVQSNASELVKNVGTFGVRTQPAWITGDGSNVRYMNAGLTQRWIDDTGYTYETATQTWYGTELEAPPGFEFIVKGAKFEALQCSATSTIACSVAVKGGTAHLLGTATENGETLMPCADPLRGRRIQPRIAMASSSAATTPILKGKLSLALVLVPARTTSGKYLSDMVPTR